MTQVVLDLTFSLSSNELISVSKDGTVAFWDLSSGERNRVLDVSSLGSSMRTKVLQSTNGTCPVLAKARQRVWLCVAVIFVCVEAHFEGKGGINTKNGR